MAERDVLTKIADVDAHEGPVWLDGALYFTSLPRHERPGHPVVDIRRLALDTGEVTTVRADANAANGMTLAPDGRLLVCEQGTLDEPARISAVDPATGEAETVVDALAGLPLNSPNDVVVKRDGTIWFTDPSYGFLQGFKPEPAHGDFVYRFDPRPAGSRSSPTDFDKPNGLAFSPDETVLYVGDSGREPRARQLRPAPAAPHPRLRRRRRPARRTAACSRSRRPASPTGSRSTPTAASTPRAFSGVQVFDPAGELLGEIALPGRRELHLRRREPQRPLHHDRHGGLGRGRSTRKERDHMTDRHAPARSSTTAAPTRCIAAAERQGAREHGQPRRDRGRRPVRRADPAAPHRGRADRELARRGRQGPHRRDLRAAEPRDRGAGQRAAGSARSRCTAPRR